MWINSRIRVSKQGVTYNTRWSHKRHLMSHPLKWDLYDLLLMFWGKLIMPWPDHINLMFLVIYTFKWLDIYLSKKCWAICRCIQWKSTIWSQYHKNDFLLARENAVNLTYQLMSDNHLGDGMKMHMTHLETFWEQSVKMTSQLVFTWYHHITIDLSTGSNKDAAIDRLEFSSISLCF